MPTRPLLALALLATTFAAPCWSQTRPFGLGVIGGEPCGGTAKVWLNSYFAFDAAAGADFGPYSHNPFNYRVPAAFQAHGDFLAHIPLIRARNKGLRVPLYIGVGPQWGRWHHDGRIEQYWRCRTPIGLALLTPKAPFPWELFMEFAPTWGANPRIFDSDLAAGARYYF